MNVEEIFDEIEEKKKKVQKIKEKERYYITRDFTWQVMLGFSDFALLRKWHVSVFYEHELLAHKSFRKYEDALRFYEECVEEVKRRYEK